MFEYSKLRNKTTKLQCGNFFYSTMYIVQLVFWWFDRCFNIAIWKFVVAFLNIDSRKIPQPNSSRCFATRVHSTWREDHQIMPLLDGIYQGPTWILSAKYAPQCLYILRRPAEWIITIMCLHEMLEIILFSLTCLSSHLRKSGHSSSVWHYVGTHVV